MKPLLRWLPALVVVPLVLAAFLPERPEAVVVPSVFRWRNSYWLEGDEEQATQRNGLRHHNPLRGPVITH